MTLRCLNVFGRSSSENNNNNNYYSAQTQTVSNRFNASLPTSQSRAPVCVCICVSLPNALVYRLCLCVCVCVSLRTIAVNRSLALSLPLSSTGSALCRIASPRGMASMASDGKCEREGNMFALWTNCDCDCLAPVHKLVSALVFSAGAVRCGVCSFSKRTKLTYDARFFVPTSVFFSFFSIIGFWFRSLSILKERERAR